MAKATRTQRDFVAMCETEGADRVELVRVGAHFNYDVTKNGVTVRVAVPKSPSDHRWLLNKRTQLRRAFETGDTHKHQEFDT